MKKLNKILIVVFVVLLLLFKIDVKILNENEIVEAVPRLTHAQNVWINALEWCESRAKPEAVNPKDTDNTPSYYSYQFKPGTFKDYGEKYGVIEKGLSNEKIRELMKSHALQKEIVENMLFDKTVRWDRQFPDCVKNKIGYPPRY